MSELAWPPAVGVGVVEAAGGVRSPVAADGDAVEAGRGAAPRAGAAGRRRRSGHDQRRAPVSGRVGAGGRRPAVLNRFDPGDELHLRNHDWLAGRDGYDVVTDPDDLVAPIVGWPS